jgi:hypothetical protein
MDTAKLDIVYFIKNTPHNEEFRYSLRSVCQNMPFNRVWVFGGCPQNIVPDVRVRVEQTGRTKWDKVRNMYKMVCENKEITDDFIMFNDDFYVMQPTDRLVPLYRCSLSEHISILEHKRPSEYSGLLRRCQDTLGGEPLSYELHTPFIFNKEKLLRLLEDYPDAHCMRTMYGNLYKIGGEQSNDVKIFDIHPQFAYQESRFLSTDDSVVNVNNDIWRWLWKTLEKKCKYEI